MMKTSNQFTTRELEVITILLQGKSNKQMALALNISKSTVEYHLKNIYRKLDVNSRAEAILNLSTSRLYESIGGQYKENLWQSTVETARQAGYGSYAKQFFDPKEEKAMKNRAMISVFLSVIALIVAVGAVVYLKSKTIQSKHPETTSEQATTVDTPRRGIYISSEASTRSFDEVLLILGSQQPPFHYAAVFATTGCFVPSENTCGFTDPLPFPEGESLSGVSVYWMPDGENGFYVQDNRILVLNHLERKSALSDVLVSNISKTDFQLHVSFDGGWLVESAEASDPYTSDLVLAKTSTREVNKLNVGVDECFKTPLGWMTSTQFMFRCDIYAGATSKKVPTEKRFYTYDISSSQLSELASGMEIGYDTLSPNGNYVVYYEKQNGFRIKNLMNEQPYSSPLPKGQVIWAHDSSKFAIFDDTGNVYVANYDGSNQRKIYSSGMSGLTSMEWFPDNEHIAVIGYFNESLDQPQMVVLSEAGTVISYDQILTTAEYNIIGISHLPAIHN